MNHMGHPLSSAEISILLPDISKYFISRNTDIGCILMQISNSFNFSWVFKDFFSKPGYNFEDVSKNGYLRSS